MQHATELSVNLGDVLSQQVYESAPEAALLTENLKRVADTSMPKGLRSKVLAELEGTSAINPLEDVPEVRPVTQPKVCCPTPSLVLRS